MTEKDKQMIEEAKCMSCQQWSEIDDMALRADTKEAYDILHSIANEKYHREEALNDCI